MIDDEELIGEFVVESNEHLEDVENQLLSIEAGGANIDLDLVNTVFRAVHSVKGAAGFLGLDTINKLAHSLENVLNKIRNQELVPTSENTNVMLRAADTLGTLVNDTANSNSFDASSFIAELEQVEKNDTIAETVTPEQPTPQPAIDEQPQGPVPEAPVAASPEPAAVGTKPAAKPAASSEAAAKSASAAPESSIRVSVSVLDKLMNLAGELVLSRNQLLQALADPARGGIDAAGSGLDHVTSELQEAIMQTRMQPIGNVFGKFHRIVRDLSSKLSKQCQLDVKGKDVEVDKTIVEAIGDPLTHLIRNSVDHGVETPEVRTANGKSAEGSIYLRAFHKAGKVCIEIEDDGAGIDPQRLRDKALAKGILSPERAEQMSDREAVRLIFHPGFSTAEQVSDVSGRGVGMDVVRTNIEKLGGIVDVESQVGKGTVIRVTLPLTLAIIPSMIVRCGGERFAIPQANIAELVRLRPEEVSSRIASVKSGEVLRLRGNLLPLVNLGSALDLAASDQANDGQPRNVIVVETGQVRYGLVVDGLSDSEEIVVKPLGRHVTGCSYLAGATILGDGRIALILDVAGIASQAGVHLAEEMEESDEKAETESSGDEETQRLLLFHSDPADHFAVPMEVVARIERVKADKIDTVGGRELLQYRGSSLPLVSVEESLEVGQRPDYENVFVVVFNTGDREIGLVAPDLDDIREVATSIDEQTFRVPGVLGSLVIDDNLTRLIDVFELARQIHPQWFENVVTSKEEEAQPPQVLLAEDSTFFRNQVSRFLSEAGCDVVEAVDGEDAWTQLLEDVDGYDLVVTDIEMPNLNGFDLCRRIKQERSDLPIIALTSLSSDEHVELGRQVGFDDYQIKMHRENLLRAVRKLAPGVAVAKKPQTQKQLAGASA